MKRIAITDGNGQWFDSDAAEVFKEETRWDGHNHISKATGSPWSHEWLFLTKGGKWVLNRFYDYQNKGETYEVITETEAVEWFLRQGLDLPDQLEGKDADYEI